jgi:hypothetical protein
LRWFCSAALLLLLLVLLRTRTRGEDGVASAHSVAVVFVASFFLWLRRRQWRYWNVCREPWLSAVVVVVAATASIIN